MCWCTSPYPGYTLLPSIDITRQFNLCAGEEKRLRHYLSRCRTQYHCFIPHMASLCLSWELGLAPDLSVTWSASRAEAEGAWTWEGVQPMGHVGAETLREGRGSENLWAAHLSGKRQQWKGPGSPAGQGVFPAGRQLGNHLTEGGRSANEFTPAWLYQTQCKITPLRSASNIWDEFGLLELSVLKISKQTNLPINPAPPLNRSMCCRVNIADYFI